MIKKGVSDYARRGNSNNSKFDWDDILSANIYSLPYKEGEDYEEHLTTIKSKTAKSLHTAIEHGEKLKRELDDSSSPFSLLSSDTLTTIKNTTQMQVGTLKSYFVNVNVMNTFIAHGIPNLRGMSAWRLSNAIYNKLKDRNRD